MPFALLFSTFSFCCVSSCPPTCLFIQRKQTGHVTGNHVIGDLSEPASISVGGDHVEDFCAGLSVAADAHRVLVGVKHWGVIIPVLHLNVHVGLSAQASLKFGMSEKKRARQTLEAAACESNQQHRKYIMMVKNGGRALTGSSALIRMSWTVCPES